MTIKSEQAKGLETTKMVVDAVDQYQAEKERNEKFKPIARKYETGKIGYYQSLQLAFELGQSQPGIKQWVSEWIDVKDRLPEMPNDISGNKASDSVLVWNGEDVYKAYCEAVRPDFKTVIWDFSEEHSCPNCGSQYDSYDNIEQYSGKPITHWKHPEPPNSPTAPKSDMVSKEKEK